MGAAHIWVHGWKLPLMGPASVVREREENLYFRMCCQISSQTSK